MPSGTRELPFCNGRRAASLCESPVKTRLAVGSCDIKPVDVASLRAFAKTLEGKPLSTRAQGRTFHVQVVKGGLVYTPQSTGKPRPQQDKFIG